MSNNLTLNVETNVLDKLILKIKEVLKAKKLKQKDLAAHLNYDASYMSRVLNGEITMSIKTLQEIADFLKVPVHQLIEVPDGYINVYDNDKNWKGIIKKDFV